MLTFAVDAYSLLILLKKITSILYFRYHCSKRISEKNNQVLLTDFLERFYYQLEKVKWTAHMLKIQSNQSFGIIGTSILEYWHLEFWLFTAAKITVVSAGYTEIAQVCYLKNILLNWVKRSFFF